MDKILENKETRVIIKNLIKDSSINDSVTMGKTKETHTIVITLNKTSLINILIDKNIILFNSTIRTTN